MPFLGLTPDDIVAVKTIADSMAETFTETYSTKFAKEFYAANLCSADSGSEALRLKSRPVVANLRTANLSVLKGGWLTKKGEVRKNWKRRWFEMDGEFHLRYFERDDGTKSAKGKIIFYMYKVEAPVEVDGYSNCIALTHESKRCFYIFPDRASEIDQWIPFLKAACLRSRYPRNVDPHRALAFEAGHSALQKAANATVTAPEDGDVEALQAIIMKRLESEVIADAMDKLGNYKRRVYEPQTIKAAQALAAAAMQAGYDNALLFAEDMQNLMQTVADESKDEFLKADAELRSRIMGAVGPIVTGLLQSSTIAASCETAVSAVIEPLAAAEAALKTAFDTVVQDVTATIQKAGLDQDALRQFFLPLAQKLREHPTDSEHPLADMHASIQLIPSAVDRALTGGSAPADAAGADPTDVVAPESVPEPAPEPAAEGAAGTEVEAAAEEGEAAVNSAEESPDGTNDADENDAKGVNQNPLQVAAESEPAAEGGPTRRKRAESVWMPTTGGGGASSTRGAAVAQEFWVAFADLFENAVYSLEDGLVYAAEAAPLSPTRDQLRDSVGVVANLVVDDTSHDVAIVLRRTTMAALRALVEEEYEKLEQQNKVAESLPSDLSASSFLESSPADPAKIEPPVLLLA